MPRLTRVDEEDGDDLAFLAWRCVLFGERGAAHPAQAEAVRVLLAAARADRHRPILGRPSPTAYRAKDRSGTATAGTRPPANSTLHAYRIVSFGDSVVYQTACETITLDS